MNYLTENLKYLRRLRGWTQTEMAVKGCKIPFPRYQSYEHGRAEPGPDFLVVVCKRFRLSIEDLITKKLSDRNPKVFEKQFKTDFEETLLEKFEQASAKEKLAIKSLLQL